MKAVQRQMRKTLFGWAQSKKLARKLETDLQREIRQHSSPLLLRDTIEQLEAAEKAAGESHVLVTSAQTSS